MIWRKRSRLLVVTSALFAAVNVFAQPVSLELKSGDRITGKILSETNNRVVLSNAWSREITIPVAEISKRTPVVAPSNAVAGGAATNSPAKTNAVAIAKAVAATNVFFTSPYLKNWHGDLLVGADLTF